MLNFEELLAAKKAEIEQLQGEFLASQKDKHLSAIFEIREFAKKLDRPFGLVINELIAETMPNRAVAAKYRHPDGRAWSGRGKRPIWLQGVEDISVYLISAPATDPTEVTDRLDGAELLADTADVASIVDGSATSESDVAEPAMVEPTFKRRRNS